MLVADDGRVWTGTADGGLHVHDPKTQTTTTVAATGGRPLGLEHLPDGRILVCDAHRGLLALDPVTGDLETLLREVDGERLLFPNNAAVTADGTIWFTDSSRVWTIEDWKSDLIEHTCTGRLFRRTPSGHVDTVLDGLCFANGVALTAEQDAVLVAETGTRTIRRVELAGDGGPGATTTWVEDLPGPPRQHRPRQRRAGLGDRRHARPTPLSRCSRRARGRSGSSSAGSPSGSNRRRSAPRGSWPWTPRAARCTTSTSTRPRGTSPPGSASTTAGSGSAASSSRRSPSVTCPTA